MADKKLLPCPFCGGEAELYSYKAERNIYDSNSLGYVDTEHFEKHGVGCPLCGCVLAEFLSEEKAVEAWNTRKPMEWTMDNWKELRAYRELGTVEELQDLKKKSVAKKPFQPFGTHSYKCPTCWKFVAHEVDDNCDLKAEMAEWCPFCGQHLNWD